MGHVIVLRGLAHQCQGSHPLADRPDLRQAGFADVLVHHLASFGMDRLGMFDAIVSFHPPDVVGEDNFAGQLGSRDIAFGYCRWPMTEPWTAVSGDVMPASIMNLIMPSSWPGPFVSRTRTVSM